MARPPFPGTSLMQKLRRQLTQPTPLVTDHRPDVPPVVVALVRKLMDTDRAGTTERARIALKQVLSEFDGELARLRDAGGEPT